MILYAVHEREIEPTARTGQVIDFSEKLPILGSLPIIFVINIGIVDFDTQGGVNRPWESVRKTLIPTFRKMEGIFVGILRDRVNPAIKWSVHRAMAAKSLIVIIADRACVDRAVFLAVARSSEFPWCQSWQI